jgi:hypothetical protein
MTNGHHHASQEREGDLTVPIEFRRKIICQQSPVTALNQVELPKSPVSKLIHQEHLAKATNIPSVEVYPRKIIFTVTNGTTAAPIKETILKPNISKAANGSITTTNELYGYALASQEAPVVDVLQAIMKLAAPSRLSACVRVWSKRGHTTRRGDKNSLKATAHGDDFELIRFDSIDGSLLQDLKTKGEIPSKPQKSTMTVQQWMVKQVGPTSMHNSVEVLVETKSNLEAHWPRRTMELENRIQVTRSRCVLDKAFLSLDSVCLLGRCPTDR